MNCFLTTYEGPRGTQVFFLCLKVRKEKKRLGTPALMHSLKQFSMSDKRIGQTKLIRNKIIFEKKIVATEKH